MDVLILPVLGAMSAGLFGLVRLFSVKEKSV